MKTLFWGSLIFSSFFGLHLLVWKVRLPRRQVKTLLYILFGGLAVSLASLVGAPLGFQALGVAPPQGPAELLHVALLVTALILAYMITYTALEADSPSLVMTSRLVDAGPRGVLKEEFETFLNDDLLVLPRIRDLLTDQMAVLEDGRYRLTPKGRLMARIFMTHRAMMGLEKGG